MYKGRDFVRITGRCIYTRYTDILSVTRKEVDLINNPEKAVQLDIAAIILAHGMSGLFTGKRLWLSGILRGI